MTRSEVLELLESALKTADDPSWHLVFVVFIKGESLASVASSTGSSRWTLYKRLAKALRELKACVKTDPRFKDWFS